jgi:hypothetical protein
VQGLIPDAATEFERAMHDSENLLEAHKELRQGEGRRFREMSLNRAVVVLTVAAWQAFVQDLVAEILKTIEVPAGDPGREYFRLLSQGAKRASFLFSTPNADNTRSLLMNVGFDPWPYWTWNAGRWQFSETRVREMMNQWLQVRHAIAHGHDELPVVSVLSPLPGDRATLRRGDAEACVTFFQRAVRVTTIGAEGEFA